MLGAAQANWRALAWKWHKPGLRLQLCLCLDVWFWEGYLPPWASDFPECSHHVNESGAWLQRSIKRQVKGKESLFYFRGCTRGWGVGRADWYPKVDSPHLHWQPVDKSFYRWREGATWRNCTVSSVILKLIFGGLISIILIALSVVNLQFQGQFIPISLRPILRIVAKLCHSCFPGGSDGKESACNAGDLGSLSGLGRSPGGGNGNPLQYSRLENSVDRGTGTAIVHGVPKGRTWLSN